MLENKATTSSAPPLTSLNHVSILCRSVELSLHFYQNVLGFIPVRRPNSFDFNGAWLFNYGVGIHLIQCDKAKEMPMKAEIDPKDNHISFQCESVSLVEKRLKDMGIAYLQSCVEEGGVQVDQLFFHDPDGFMIEICNCDNLPVIPLGAVNGDTATRAACKRVGLIREQQWQQLACEGGTEPHIYLVHNSSFK